MRSKALLLLECLQISDSSLFLTSKATCEVSYQLMINYVHLVPAPRQGYCNESLYTDDV